MNNLKRSSRPLCAIPHYAIFRAQLEIIALDAAVTEGITANIFHLINNLAVEAVETGGEQICDEAVQPEHDMEAAFA